MTTNPLSRIFLSPLDGGLDERDLPLDAFDSNGIAPLGPHVDPFEAKIARRRGTRRCYEEQLGDLPGVPFLALVLAGFPWCCSPNFPTWRSPPKWRAHARGTLPAARTRCRRVTRRKLMHLQPTFVHLRAFGGEV